MEIDKMGIKRKLLDQLESMLLDKEADRLKPQEVEIMSVESDHKCEVCDGGGCKECDPEYKEEMMDDDEDDYQISDFMSRLADIKKKKLDA